MTIRRERKDAAEHNQLILQTAQSLFKEHGVHTVSMHQIAKTAGIGQATLYRRYAHKGDLCSDILEGYGKQLMKQINSYLDENIDQSPLERLGGITDCWIDAIEEKSDLIITMETKTNCDDPRGNFFHSPMYLFFREVISRQLVEMIGPAQPGDPDPELTAHTLICSMSPVGYYHIKHEKNYTTDQMKHNFRRMHQLIAR